MQGGAYKAIQDRLDAFESSGDHLFVTDLHARGEVSELRASIGWPAFHPVPDDALIRRELDAIVLAGRFLLARVMRSPGGSTLEEMLEATELFVAAYPYAPGAVPRPLQEVCSRLSSRPPEVDHVVWQHEAIDLLDAAERTRDLALIDRAIGLLASAALAAREELPLPYYLSHLGTAWMDRFRITGRAADLEHAITAHQRATAIRVPLDEDQAGHLANYGAVLLARFEQDGDVHDLHKAVSAGRAAVKRAQAARGHLGWLPSWSREQRAVAVSRAEQVSLSNLSATLSASWDYQRNRADLDESIAVARAAAKLTLDDDPDRAGLLANLAQAVLERFTRFWQAADLEDAVVTAQAAVSAAPAEHPARSMALLSFALASRARFTYYGDQGDLAKAIDAGRQVLGSLPPGHPKEPACRSNLAVALSQWYYDFGDTDALAEAVTMVKEAVEAAPRGYVRRPSFLNNLGLYLRARFAVEGRLADISESVAALEEAVATALGDEIDRTGYVANLASSLVMASEHGGGPALLTRAIALLGREAAALGGGHPLQHRNMSSLGSAWRARFEATGDPAALDEAISYYRRAVEAVPVDHSQRAEYLAGLGNLLRRIFERTSDPAAGREALGLCRAAAAISAAPASVRAHTARDWGEVAAGLGDAVEAMNGLAAAVDLLDLVAWQDLGRRDQERQLGGFVALACDAAAMAIHAGALKRAVELLEQGRGVLLAQALNQRARHHDLHYVAPDLVQRLTSLDNRLEQLNTADDHLRAPDEALAAWRTGLARERNAVLERIRALPGFADFLKPPSFASLRHAATGPVVIINVSAHRCDALIVTSVGVQVTALPELTGESAAREAARFIAALYDLHKGDLAKRTRAAQTIVTSLGWLWDTVISPLLPEVLAATGTGTRGQRPRVWWCPTGPLTFLPLHAAGHHNGGGQTVIDHLISSYAPTLRLLQRAQQSTPKETSGGRPLAVALPVTPGQQDLPEADREADDFASLFTRARVLRGPQATVDTVQQALTDCPPQAHFACHGTQNVADPSAGHLLLHDGPLSIGEISTLRLRGAELAFLSACETSRGGVELADEAITLATAFHLAGYRHVIGTLWPIADRLAADVANDVYQALMQPGRPGILASGTGAALDAAVVTLRGKRPAAPWLWAPYVHIGP